ncbi:hypothetical protein EUX98_g1753 [Antrodiella citrinella]|uniref:Alcohol dehydrogenase iron-type/glycerol dehydrogenase GldA domain-containing protein n=1 Tax=Antrodiella citrinella TaxID=2447956 RepID=A0A4S4N243_9APHY|nr:hypothetical protein EUX98_g1753 [Antrodiella citrinella]
MPNPKQITERYFQSPSKYIQGPAAIKNAAQYLEKLGKKPLLTCDSIVYNIAGKNLITALETHGFQVTRAEFAGETSGKEIDRLADLGKNSDFVIGLGGGKTMDTAKAVASKLNLAVAILPTTASTDAPAPRSPSSTPRPASSSGMGDAIATNVEARLCKSSLNFGGGLPTEVATAIGNKCEEILLAFGKQAYEANKAQVVTPAFEKVVEANTLMSGLGFESGGLAAAHAIHNGFTAIPGLHHLLHGEKVAFGTVAQLILVGTPTAELEVYLAFMLSVDLPFTFAQLGIPEVTNEELRRVATLSCAPGETIWNMEDPVTEELVFGAIKAADAVGREFIARSGKKL